MSGDTAVVGAYLDHHNGIESGSAYVFVRTGSTWTEQAKLTASDGAGGDDFGLSVSVDGDTAVVGAFLDDDSGNWSGSAYVFTRTGSTWTEQAKLTASDGASDDWFGYSVSVDGDTAVVGAVYDDHNGIDSGSACVFTRTGSTWTEQAKLTASDGAAGDVFGVSVSVSGDTAVVAAHNDDDSGSNSGSAYVFVRTGSTWTEQAKLTASDAAGQDQFGVSVSVDGDTAVVGAYSDDDNGIDSGSAYVFSPVSPELCPEKILRLLAVKEPNQADARFWWDLDVVAGLYRVYSVDAIVDMPPRGDNLAATMRCDTPDGVTDTCVHIDAVADPQWRLFYQVVGACPANQANEGPN